ncbi:hypothetical protein I4U23_010586 [Adineta vaga]|nr:hypothetical protein I4U23_010586 [Adineta vaga]
MSYCMLDNLPWVVLHSIFDYLTPYDLFNAFDQVNSHLDTILQSYQRLQLNFQSIKKSLFYFICQHIYPEQIQSLLLSDDSDTSNQIQLFMSFVPLIKCINLQSITIHCINDPNLFFLILSHLEDHRQLHSLSVTNYSHKISKRNSRNIVKILTSLTSLKRLTFFKTTPLIHLQQPLLKLTHLTLESGSFADLVMIFPWIPNLLHLDIRITIHEQIPTFDYIPPHLNYLKIHCRTWMLFQDLENILSLTSFLEYFILETLGESTLLQAKRWEILIKSKLPQLKQFDINITPEENTLTRDDVLLPFENSFWKNERRCHMICIISYTSNSCVRLFSVPYFAPIDEYYPPNEWFINYSLTPYLSNDRCKELKIEHCLPQTIPSFFPNIQTLTLQNHFTDVNGLQGIMNLSSVNHLKFETTFKSDVFHELVQVVPNVYQLTLAHASLPKLIEVFSPENNIYEQINSLHITDIISRTDIEQINRIFPKLERITLYTRERDDILSILDKFQYLISTNIHWTCPFKTTSAIIDESLQKNHICTDNTYYFHQSQLYIWND